MLSLLSFLLEFALGFVSARESSVSTDYTVSMTFFNDWVSKLISQYVSSSGYTNCNTTGTFMKTDKSK